MDTWFGCPPLVGLTNVSALASVVLPSEALSVLVFVLAWWWVGVP